MSPQPSLADRRARSVGLPADSGLASWFENADLADAYAIELGADCAERDVQSLAAAMNGNPAPWVRMLLALRDIGVAGLGLKTTAKIRRAAVNDKAERIDFFRVLSRSRREVIMGEDDRHLDFRASLLVRSRPDGSGRELVATTVVRCHNRLGRAYLALIAPFHRLIVRTNLERASRNGWRTRSSPEGA
jgi:hypothetical protein